MVSVSRMTVATMQDLLQLDEQARMDISKYARWGAGYGNDQEQLTESVEEVLTWDY